MDDDLSKVRDAKFKNWLQNKALRDKAIEYLQKLDNGRAEHEESLVEVGIALCAVDRMLGNDDPSRAVAANEGDEAQKAKPGSNSKPASKKLMRDFWLKWTTENHSFNQVALSSVDVARFTGAVKEFLDNDPEHPEIFILPSLKYFFPAVPKANEKPKPLTSDQREQNAIFMRECRKLWRKVKEEMNNRIIEYIAKGLQKRGFGGGRGGGGSEQQRMESERKSKASGGLSTGSLSSRLDNDDDDERGEGVGALKKRLEMACLNELSLKQFRMWIEEDEDAKAKKDAETHQEKLVESKIAHEQFVKQKDSLRIRMPEGVAPPSNSGMGFGREQAGVKPVAKGSQSTVDMMAGLGLKYVHATNRGRRGVEGDLEKSRNQLLKLGHVLKENFDPDDIDEFRREKRENTFLRDKQQQEARMREQNAKAYEEWVEQKEMRDQALKCLSLMEKPRLSSKDLRASTASMMEGGGGGDDMSMYSTDSYGTRQSNTGRRKIGGGAGGNASEGLIPFNLQRLRPTPATNEAITVGRALKKIDRTLYLDWATWADRVFHPKVASTLWDSFAPTACDIHSSEYSQTRDAFLKLLRPGVDFRQTFIDFGEKLLRRRQERSGADDMEAQAKEKALSEISISKKNMSTLLLQLGIAMKETDMRALIDSFDSNGDGVITLTEFLDFIGPVRSKKGGNSLVLNQKCCWITTCKVTGMANAYSVSAPTKRFLRAEAKGVRGGGAGGDMDSKAGSRRSRSDGVRASDPDFEADMKQQQGVVVGKTVIRVLANGEKRMCVELSDRGKREEILRRLGLLGSAEQGQGKGKGSSAAAADGKRRKKGGKRGNDNDDDYGDDEYEEEEEEDEYGDDEHGFEADPDHEDTNGQGGDGTRGDADSKAGGGEGGKKHEGPRCDFCTWESKKRKAGLAYIMDVSRDVRREETLKTLLSSGTAPSAPKLWSNANVHQFAHADQDGIHDLEVHWAPQKGDLVSFYSLEFGGPVAGANTKYREIYRDPEDADPEKTFQLFYVINNLQPGVSYNFRIRAFNGFGPGDFAYKVFTTRTEAPLLPRVIKLAADSVTLRWTFSKGFFRRLEELKKIFSLADSDGSGQVSREELTALLDERASSSPELRVFLGKVAAGFGLDLSQGYGVLFDMIEGDDNGGLSWEEFEAFFMNSGWGNVASIAPRESQMSLRSSLGGGFSHTSTAVGAGAGAGAPRPGEITYVVERCDSEFDKRYTEVLRSTLGQGTVSRLEPGKSYRFRVYSVNVNGVAGERSPDIVVHTMLEMPPAPSVSVTSGGSRNGLRNGGLQIFDRKVVLRWRPRSKGSNSRDKAVVERMLGDWAGTHGENDGGVSIEAAFAKYDKDRSGDIDASELALVLEDLGVEVTEERLSEAFSLLDANSDGVISYEEFGAWWRRDEVTYTVKRSEEVLPLTTAVNGRINGINATSNQSSAVSLAPSSVGGRGNGRAASRGREATSGALSAIAEETSRSERSGARTLSRSRFRPAAAGTVADAGAAVDTTGAIAAKGAKRQVGVPIVSYRGAKPRCEIAGLLPNHLYHFKLRYVGSRSNSMLSPPLVLMTLPLPPSKPVLVSLTSTGAKIKWYAPAQYGAMKFLVQMKQVPNPETGVYAPSGATRRIGSAQSTVNGNSNGHGNASTTGTWAAPATAGVAGAAAAAASGGGEGWSMVYNGQESLYSNGTLASDTTYVIRVFALNCQGNMSSPSPELTFSTLPRGEASRFTLTPRNAGSTFTIECNGDICVGDTILITERLFRRAMATGAGAAGVIGAGETDDVASTRGGRSVSGRSHTGVRDSTTGAVRGSRGAAKTPLNASVTSIHSLDAHGGSTATVTPANGGELLGERTIAGYVSKDNYRNIRDSLAAARVEPRTGGKKLSKFRRLTLEVVWQRGSSNACKPYELRVGEVIERVQDQLEQFEVFRCRWDEEKSRRPFAEEWELLQDCFVQTDC